MTFKEAVKTCLVDKYATFSGRATRSEYWYFFLFYYFFTFCLGFIVGFSESDHSLAVIGLLCLPILLPSLAVSVRRLHDTGRSGWWFFITFVPYIGGIALLIFLCQKSDEDNKYGSNPKMVEKANK